jgi:zinc/manganese transport system ATP-binding protein/zinc transport system ATP-binding protein
MQPLIEFKDVSFAYGTLPVLDGIFLHIHRGQLAALVGPSGAGKTTLLQLVLGTLAPTHGEITIGNTTNGKSGLRIGYVPQLETVDWNFPVTVEQVVLMGRAGRHNPWPWPNADDRRRLHAVLESLGIENLAGRHIRELSGGQQQRTFLARALIAQPDLLVLDEPTSGVDMRSSEALMHLLVELNKQGVTILMTTHDLNMAAAHVPWVLCLNRCLIAQGTPDDVFTPATLNEAYHGDMAVIKQDGMIFIQQKPHPHTLHDVLPQPIKGHLP